MSTDQGTSTDWPLALRLFDMSIAAHFVWEILQLQPPLPLYTLWSTVTLRQQVLAVVHRKLGDAIVAGAFVPSGAGCLRASWPQATVARVYAASLGIGSQLVVGTKQSRLAAQRILGTPMSFTLH